MRTSLIMVILFFIIFMCPAWAASQSSLPHTVTIYPGSLKNNITRIAKTFGWKTVVWNVSKDYNWIGKTTIKNQSVVTVMQKILNNFPLQARFYKGNHILAIVPRTL